MLTWISSTVSYPRHFLEVFHYLHVTFIFCYIQGSPLMERMKHSLVKHENLMWYQQIPDKLNQRLISTAILSVFSITCSACPPRTLPHAVRLRSLVQPCTVREKRCWAMMECFVRRRVRPTIGKAFSVAKMHFLHFHWKQNHQCCSHIHMHTYSHSISEADISSTANKVYHCVFMASFSCSKQKGSLMKCMKRQIVKHGSCKSSKNLYTC